MQTISKIVTHYSLTKSIVRSEKLMKIAKEKGIKTLILADINSLSGSVDFLKEAQSAGIKPIIGVTLSLIPEDCAKYGGTITLLAKNLKGWKSLLKIVSHANTPENFKDHPQIKLRDLSKLIIDQSLIALTGGYNSHLAHLMVDHEGRFASLYDEVKTFARKDWVEACRQEVKYLQGVFGPDNVYLEIQPEYSSFVGLLNKGNRYLAQLFLIKAIPSNPVHYINQEDWFDQHLMLCSGLGKKKSHLREIKDIADYPFICGPNFYLNTSDDGYTKEELDNLQKLDESCETYKVFNNPRLPKFNCPNDLSEPDYLRQLCREGWKKKIEGKIPKDKLQEYVDRVKEELDIIADVDSILGEPLISRYFLIVSDYVGAAKKRGELVGYGRGSAAGSIVANLLDITDVDPIKYGLLFSRFFNKGRITKEKFSLPDIDIDFQSGAREDTIAYIKSKYGKELVGQVVTFGSLHGKGAIKEVFRINEIGSQSEVQAIADIIPDSSKISDDLQEMKDEGEEVSNIIWALQHNTEKLKRWCYIDDNGNYQGEYARLFEQAIRLEGTLKTQSSHACAIIVGPEPLSNLCPMIFSKTKEDPICGLEFEYLEGMGLFKCDALVVAELNKLNETKKLLRQANG